MKIEPRKFLVSMFNLETGRRVSIPRIIVAETSGAAIESYKRYKERIGESTEGYMVMAKEYHGE